MTTIFNQDMPALKAWVVFTGQADYAFLKVLKKGYRHCFLILHDGQNWVSMDPLFGRTELLVHRVPSDFDMAKWLESRGHVVVPAPLLNPRHLAWPALFTCVEAVKRALGLQKLFILTPWQLYRYLTREQRAAKPPFLLRLRDFFHRNFKEATAWAV